MTTTPTTLEDLVRALHKDIYLLALRILWNREAAEDATLKILAGIAAGPPPLDSGNPLALGAYRASARYLLNVRESAIERQSLSFNGFADDLASGLQLVSPDEAERSMLVEEVKVACSLAMLQCLDRPHRLAYVLGEVMELPRPEAVYVLEITPDLLEARLAHARKVMGEFMTSYCGLVSDKAACRCNRRIASAAMASAENRPVQFASGASSFEETRALVRQGDQAQWHLRVHRTRPPRASSIDFARRLVSAAPGKK